VSGLELLCPECRATLASPDGQTARCTTHGGQFEILFTRMPFPALPNGLRAAPAELAIGAMCARHPSVLASYACSDCGTPVCDTCVFNETDGSHVCPDCAGRRVAYGPPQSKIKVALADGLRCVQHLHIQATAQCKTCGAFICDTCKFELPGGVCLCPSCATSPRTALSPKRKKMLIGSYALAVWCTLLTVAMFAGIFQGMLQDKGGEQAVGVLLMLLLLGPSIVGVSLGVGVMDRRLHNTMAMWIATVWNGLILGLFVLLMIIGIMKGK
jgi:hypothetical protein